MSLAGYLQDSNCVRGSSSLSPSCDYNDVVSNGDEVALAKVNGVLDSRVNIVHPGSSWPLLLVEQGDAASEDLSLSGHLGEPGDREDGAVGLVLADDVRGGPGGGQHHDGGGLALVGGHHGGDGGGGGVVCDSGHVLT